MVNETGAERFAAAVQARERERAALLPDGEENRLIQRLLGQPSVWVDVARLQHLHRLALQYRTREGAFVECGVAAGGSLAMMAAFAGPRTVWGFDSFEEMPPLSELDGGDGEMWVGMRCAGPRGERAVTDTFEGAGVSLDRTRVVKGWFVDTLPQHVEAIGPIAILRLDADWYEATRFALETLYGSMIPGGVVVIDDNGAFAGCRAAVDEFRDEHGCSELHRLPENVEAYWYT